MGASVQHGSARQGRGKKRRRHVPMSEINVTPFVDVMLVLLVIFMATAQFMTSGISVSEPEVGGKSLVSNQKETPLTVTVTGKGKVFLQESEIATAELGAKLTAIAKNSFEQPIFVKGDKRVDYGTFMSVMSEIRAAGFKRISLVTAPSQRR
ncbi:MAG: biopolymer transporter ExbD [Alphaproteobacteria bacterium]